MLSIRRPLSVVIDAIFWRIVGKPDLRRVSAAIAALLPVSLLADCAWAQQSHLLQRPPIAASCRVGLHSMVQVPIRKVC